MLRIQLTASTSQLLGHATMVALIAATVAACSSSAGNQREDFSNARSMPAVGGNQVNFRKPPQPTSRAADLGGTYLVRGRVRRGWTVRTRASQTTPHESTPDPVTHLTAATPSAAAPLATGASHVVDEGDTVYSIGRLYNVGPRDIIAANSLTNPDNIRAGQRLVIPGAAASAKAAPQPSAGQKNVSRTPASGTLTVPSVDKPPATRSEPTIAGIIAHHAVPSDIFAPNGLSNSDNIVAGHRLVSRDDSAVTLAKAVPQRAALQTVALNTPASDTLMAPRGGKPDVAKTEPRISDLPSIPVEKSSNTPSAIPASATAVDSIIERPPVNGMTFRWPVRGRIISSFGNSPSGQRNDGINLAVPLGTSVNAAEAGTVIYAGNKLEGYGNLVLIRHANDWVSAYAHNSEIKVKKGDTIRRGQTIAAVGMSGSVTSPQLHFGLRNKGEPVNPLDYIADD